MSHKKHNIPKATNSLQDECIRVQKVYDWVTDALTVRKTVLFTREQIKDIEEAMEDPGRRPLRLICEPPETPPIFPLNNRRSHDHDHDDDNLEFICEQVGEKRDVTISTNGGFVDAQLVELLISTDLRIVVVDRHGCIVTKSNINASVFESFVLCYPDGTDLFCKVSKIFCKIPSGTVLLNSPAPESFDIEITFCLDIQVEAEVKLEVLAKFCSPRDNDLIAPESVDQCPKVSFPPQCPDIFPRPNCDCSAEGEASGNTGEDSSATGRLAVLVNICPDCSLVDSELRGSFRDTDTSDGTESFNFTATTFDQDTLCCEETRGGLKLIISGEGKVDGRTVDYNFAVVDDNSGTQFQLQLIDRRGRTIFDSGVVDSDEGEVKVEDCVTFADIKVKRP
ncbi:hypothetical protein [Pseudalkalibacillus berkeleyi]|uniref:Uncharacterized protein n=1 Tax=Pseudalkalibacillus berkeleyi TaxID=1069813 RepID=A0ABS9GYR5_9BACL|nr:hypothetical protein [Pseudalkalibacillus berkeleyi]MCF6136901.1 hypothetical protein [Pseudalkalibacillus berkeleyi]